MGSPAVEKKRSAVEAPERLARKICLGSTGMDVSEFLTPVSFKYAIYLFLGLVLYVNNQIFIHELKNIYKESIYLLFDGFQVSQRCREAFTCSKKWVDKKSGIYLLLLLVCCFV